jgi:hypothetical protein
LQSNEKKQEDMKIRKAKKILRKAFCSRKGIYIIHTKGFLKLIKLLLMKKFKQDPTGIMTLTHDPLATYDLHGSKKVTRIRATRKGSRK